MSNDYYITPEDFKRAEGNGISNDTLRQCVYSYGWPKEKAITKPASNGTGWKDYKDIAEEYGICYRTFVDRRKRGLDPYEAATKPVMKKVIRLVQPEQVKRIRCLQMNRYDERSKMESREKFFGIGLSVVVRSGILKQQLIHQFLHRHRLHQEHIRLVHLVLKVLRNFGIRNERKGKWGND